MELVETIVAVATAQGRAGIGVVRLSGPEAVRVADGLLRLKRPLEAGRARFGELIGEDGARLDEVVATYFAGPRSYTGEDVVEIACHGAPVLLAEVVRRACALGARLAEPGEFTERAFHAGRLDLTQAEAVRDLIDARTLEQAQTAARQMGGALARAVAEPKRALVELIAGLEAGIDFAEDDLDLMSDAEALRRIRAVAEPLRTLAATYRYGRVLREGAVLAILGRPNVGKSSLFNRLVERDRAIVTAEAGTTRDLVVERISLGGVPVELVDTAGLREGVGEAEQLGIAKSREAGAEADVVVLVLEAGVALNAEELGLLKSLQGRPHVVVWNKADLARDEAAASLHACTSDLSTSTANIVGTTDKGSKSFGMREPVQTSALTGEGIPALRARLLAVLGRESALGDGALVTGLRQHQSLTTSVAALEAAEKAIEAGLAHEFLLLDLYASLGALDALTGTTTSEDVLRLIFSTFCIGK